MSDQTQTVDVTPDELVDVLRDATPGRIVTYTYTSTPSGMRKTKPRRNPFWDRERKHWSVKRTSQQQGMIGASYKNAVNNQRAREAEQAGYDPDEVRNFEPAPRYWGERIDDTPLVRHEKDGEVRYYMEVLKFHTLSSTWTDDEGNIVSPEDVEPFMPDRKEGSDRQGTDKPIRVRNVRVENLDSVSVGGRTYRVVE